MPERFPFQALVSGGVLISRAVASQVPSALRGLTSVFGMGTGGSLLPSSPEFLRACVWVALASLALPFASASRLSSRFPYARTFKTAQ